jgi:hypothetical protein
VRDDDDDDNGGSWRERVCGHGRKTEMDGRWWVVDKEENGKGR